jgi:hypothetical protein
MKFWTPEPVFISTAYFINVYQPIVCRQRVVKMLPRQRIQAQQYKNCWRNFLCGPYRIKRKQETGSSQNLLFQFCCKNIGPNTWYIARFEVFTAVTMNNGVFWDVTPCGSCKNRRFGSTYCLLHQGDNRWTRKNAACVGC